MAVWRRRRRQANQWRRASDGAGAQDRAPSCVVGPTKPQCFASPSSLHPARAHHGSYHVMDIWPRWHTVGEYVASLRPMVAHHGLRAMVDTRAEAQVRAVSKLREPWSLHALGCPSWLARHDGHQDSFITGPRSVQAPRALLRSGQGEGELLPEARSRRSCQQRCSWPDGSRERGKKATSASRHCSASFPFLQSTTINASPLLYRGPCSLKPIDCRPP